MNTELLPCPHCGAAARFGACVTGKDDESAGAEYIECTSCGASTCLVFAIMDSAKVLLAERWNRRSQASASPAPLMTDAEIEQTFIKAGGRWNGDTWLMEDADLHPFVRSLAAELVGVQRTLRDGRPMPTSDAGWLHLLDMERQEWYMRGKEHSDQAQASQAAEIAEFNQQQPKDEK